MTRLSHKTISSSSLTICNTGTFGMAHGDGFAR
jgi:hypothetical protein